MRKFLLGLTLIFTLVSVLGLILPAWAAEKTINVLFDNGVDASLNARQARSQENLANWMAPDLVRVFGRYEKSGYQAKLIEKHKDFAAGADNYLLTVKITDYNPGSKAARIVVGYGAGGVTLKIHYELSNGANTILSKDDSVFSGREWINAARKLNENTAKAVTEKLSSK